MTSSTETIVSALNYLAEEGIYSNDGVANAAIAEAAERLENLNFSNKCLENQHKIFNITIAANREAIDRLTKEVEEAEAYADRLIQHKDMSCLPKDLENLREANGYFAEENEILKVDCKHFAQYVLLLQAENEKLESKLKEQCDNSGMKRFAMNLDNLKDEVLLELILQESKVATNYDYKTFYTNTEGMPENWYDQFATDYRTAVHREHKGETFLIVYSGYDVELYDYTASHPIAYIFYKDRVYSFDAYFTDCEIFQQVIKGKQYQYECD